jgi:hypothetical protein
MRQVGEDNEIGFVSRSTVARLLNENAGDETTFAAD